MKRRGLLEKVLPPVASYWNLAEEASSLRQLTQALVSHTPAAIAVVDRDIRFLGLSDRWRREYGLGDRDVIGQRLYDVMPDTEALWADVHVRCLAGETLDPKMCSCVPTAGARGCAGRSSRCVRRAAKLPGW